MLIGVLPSWTIIGIHYLHIANTNYQHTCTLQALTLDCGNHWPGRPVNQKINWPPKKPTGPPKTCNDPNVFAAGIYDFTREVAHFCTLGLYITKNKYELTLPSEFRRFPVKIMAAYEALKKKKKKKKKHWPLGPVESKLWWPELARQPQKGMRASRHIANVKACIDTRFSQV